MTDLQKLLQSRPELLTISGTLMMTVHRQCPQCSSRKFLHADCDAGRKALGGYRLACLQCTWKGFGLQLVPHERGSAS